MSASGGVISNISGAHVNMCIKNKTNFFMNKNCNKKLDVFFRIVGINQQMFQRYTINYSENLKLI